MLMRKRLNNGLYLKTSIIKNAKSICVLLKLPVGAVTEPQNKRGITHLVEHLSFRKSRNIAQADFYYEIEKIGAFLRGATYRDCTIFEISAPKEYFLDALSVIRGLFEDNGWTYEDIRLEKNVVIRQIKNQNDFRFKQLIYDFFCKSPLGDDVIGTESKVLKCTMSDILNRKKEMFSTVGAEIIAVGDLNTTDEEKIESCFSDIPLSVSGTKVFSPDRFLNRTQKDFHSYDDGLLDFSLSVAFDIDFSKVKKETAEFIRSMLFSGLTSPFSLVLREQSGLIDEVVSGCESYDFGGIMYLMLATDETGEKELLSLTKTLFEEQRLYPDERAFICAKSALCERFFAINLNPCDFAYTLAFNDNITSPEEYIRKNKKISYEEVRTAINEIFRKENSTVNIYNGSTI